MESYVRNCAWARDSELKIDSTQILCESYKNKKGSQKFFQNDNPLELISGTNYFQRKTKLFDHVVGFAKFSEYLVVAEVGLSKLSLPLAIYPIFLVHAKPAIFRSPSIARRPDVLVGQVPAQHAS